jgi:hypothetical protein
MKTKESKNTKEVQYRHLFCRRLMIHGILFVSKLVASKAVRERALHLVYLYIISLDSFFSYIDLTIYTK